MAKIQNFHGWKENSLFTGKLSWILFFIQIQVQEFNIKDLEKLLQLA